MFNKDDWVKKETRIEIEKFKRTRPFLRAKSILSIHSSRQNLRTHVLQSTQYHNKWDNFINIMNGCFWRIVVTIHEFLLIADCGEKHVLLGVHNNRRCSPGQMNKPNDFGLSELIIIIILNLFIIISLTPVFEWWP